MQNNKESLVTCEQKLCGNKELCKATCPPKSPDMNVEAIRAMLLTRSEVGLKKYGVTTVRNDLNLRDWLQHALEEVLDQAVYLRAAIRFIDERANDGK